MAMGKRRKRQRGLWVPTSSLAKSPGHPFYERLSRLLDEECLRRGTVHAILRSEDGPALVGSGRVRIKPCAKVYQQKEGSNHVR